MLTLEFNHHYMTNVDQSSDYFHSWIDWCLDDLLLGRWSGRARLCNFLCDAINSRRAILTSVSSYSFCATGAGPRTSESSFTTTVFVDTLLNRQLHTHTDFARYFYTLTIMMDFTALNSILGNGTGFKNVPPTAIYLYACLPHLRVKTIYAYCLFTSDWFKWVIKSVNWCSIG